MDKAQLGARLQEMFDDELMFHGFTNYMRDYELVVYQSVDPNPAYGLVPRHLRFLFRICTEVGVRSTVRPDVWTSSIDDRLLETHHVTMEDTGFVWGTQCQILYPGPKIIEDSVRAKWWADEVGVEFHEVLIEGNAHAISIVFSDLVVEEVRDGYTPYTVIHNGIAEQYAAGTHIPLPPDP